MNREVVNLGLNLNVRNGNKNMWDAESNVAAALTQYD
jgi:hypothetical protein